MRCIHEIDNAIDHMVFVPYRPVIEINLNVKIEHEIRLQVDKELEGLFDEDSEVF